MALDATSVTVLVLAALAGLVVLRGLAWLFFGDWWRALLTTTLVTVVLVSGVVPTAAALEWVHDRLPDRTVAGPAR